MAKSKSTAKALMLVALAIVCIVLVIVLDVKSLLPNLIAWIQGLGAVGLIIYMLVYALATVLFVPGSLLTLGAGVLFGFTGIIVVAVGATLGAVGAFVAGKYFLTDWVTSLVAKFPRFQAIHEAISEKGGKIIFLLRLSPLFPFNASNYLYALTSVSVWSYTLATLFGILPGTIMYVYFGTLLNTIATASERAQSPLELVFFGLGLAVTVVVTIYATKVAKNALKNTVK